MASLPLAVVTRKLPESAISRLSAVGELRIWEKELPPTPEELIEFCAGAEGLLCLLTDNINVEFLDAVRTIKVVSQMAVGVDNIDVRACADRKIVVGNTPGVLAETTADLAFALMLATARRLREAEDYLRTGEWQTWSPMLLTGPDVHHATIGIIGLGNIGFEMARRANGFNMQILYHNRTRNLRAENEFGARFVTIEGLLKESDFVSLHCPLTPETKGLISKPQFELMKPSAILINTARGPVVDVEALCYALNGGQIAGAGIDVFDIEPLPMDSPLLSTKNITLVPHIGSASVKTRTKMANLAVDNLIAGLQGRPLPHSVHPK